MCTVEPAATVGMLMRYAELRQSSFGGVSTRKRGERVIFASYAEERILVSVFTTVNVAAVQHHFLQYMQVEAACICDACTPQFFADYRRRM